MWEGRYRKWNPIPIFDGKCLYVEAVHDDWEGFRIWFTSENTKLGVVLIARFEGPLMYVSSNESYRLSVVQNSDEMKFPHLFWKVDDSQLVKEFHRQSVGAYDDWKIQHFAFLSGEDCVDVLSVLDPVLENKLDAEHFSKADLESD